jgi:hypothetical protein
MKTMKKKEVSAQVVLQAIKKRAAPIEKKVSDLQIKSNDDYDRAAQLLSQLKAYDDEAEMQRTSITGPLNTALKATNALFKPFKDHIAFIVADTKEKMKAFVVLQEGKKNALETAYAKGQIKSVSKFTSDLASAQVSSGHAAARTIKILRIVELLKIPREYMVPDEAKIKQALKDGLTVAGCILVDDKQIAIS